METFKAIEGRRSIRKFQQTPIPKEVVQKILSAAVKAPSAKNRQPWKFYVVENKKPALLDAMAQGIENETKGYGLLPNSQNHLDGARHTLNIMRDAPVILLVFNTQPSHMWGRPTVEDMLFDTANIQSVGAAIENMLLAAQDLGIGSLWICDVFFAYREIVQWLGEKNQLVAAVAFGYANESPSARPKKSVADTTQWM